ncbi:hypothetical protein [Methanoregula sp.]
MTSSGWQVSAGLLMVILVAIIIAGFFFLPENPRHLLQYKILQ